MCHDGHSASDEEPLSSGKHSRSNMLQMDPRKRQYVVNNFSRTILIAVELYKTRWYIMAATSVVLCTPFAMSKLC